MIRYITPDGLSVGVDMDIDTARMTIGGYMQPAEIDKDASYHTTHSFIVDGKECGIDHSCAICSAILMRDALTVIINNAIENGESNGV